LPHVTLGVAQYAVVPLLWHVVPAAQQNAPDSDPHTLSPDGQVEHRSCAPGLIWQPYWHVTLLVGDPSPAHW
jgi:hypothetical protein